LSNNSFSQYDGYAPPFYKLGDTDDYGRLSSLGLGGQVATKTPWGQLSLRSHQVQSQRQTYSQGEAGFSSKGIGSEQEITLTPLEETKDWLIGLTHQKYEMNTLSPDYAGGFTALGAQQTHWGLFLLGSHRLAPKTKISGAYRSEFTKKSTDQTFHLALNHHIAREQIIGISVATGHKRPSLFQLYSDYSKPDLRLETSLMSEAFWSYRSKSWQFDLTVYERWSKDLIVFASCFGRTTSLCALRPFGHYDNLNKANHKGLEVSASYQFRSGRISLSHNQITALGKGANGNGRDLPRSPTSIGQIQYETRLTPSLRLNLRAKATGPAFDDVDNLIKLKGFTDLSLGLAFRPKGRIEWVFRGENLGNSQQTTAYGYSGPARRLSLGVRVKL